MRLPEVSCKKAIELNSEYKELPFYTQQVDPFEIGALAIPFVILNVIVLLIGIKDKMME